MALCPLLPRVPRTVLIAAQPRTCPSPPRFGGERQRRCYPALEHLQSRPKMGPLKYDAPSAPRRCCCMQAKPVPPNISVCLSLSLSLSRSLRFHPTALTQGRILHLRSALAAAVAAAADHDAPRSRGVYQSALWVKSSSDIRLQPLLPGTCSRPTASMRSLPCWRISWSYWTYGRLSSAQSVRGSPGNQVVAWIAARGYRKTGWQRPVMDIMVFTPIGFGSTKSPATRKHCQRTLRGHRKRSRERDAQSIRPAHCSATSGHGAFII